MQWITKNETELRSRFLKRFQDRVQEDTRKRFIADTDSDLLRNRMHQAIGEFDRMQRDLDNARKRLRDQLDKLDEEEKDAKQEIEQELRILRGRLQSLNRTTALEILTDNGLLPNYAFPERGVRFYGAIYNKHRRAEQEHKPIEVTRPAGVALKELAPANHFYTHSRCFDIQQIAIGNQQQPIVHTWAICGACGHMRRAEELEKPEAQPACPQCGHDRDADCQLDRGQHRRFVEFSQSQALSYMEHYDSLSGDRSDERNRQAYQVVRSFDLTQDVPAGAVGDEGLPFGIEYRASVTLREVNVGYLGEPGLVPFGVDQRAPEEGFRVCRDCGIAVLPGTQLDEAGHRRSCSRRRQNDKRRQEGRSELPYNWEPVYLYRELRSEAIRLLLPIADDNDVDTLTACIHLGLRLRFEGNPAHLIVAPQIMPDPASGMKRYYLVLLDAVPGGTGYLKTLYQDKGDDPQRRDGEGIMQVMRLAKNALETCVCRKMKDSLKQPDTDGCYRCIRTYHMQYSAKRISRERGITPLTKLIEAGQKRVPQQELAAIKPHSLFGSMLEKKFADTLQAFVVQDKKGTWEETIIRGNQGFRFSLPGVDRLWELELQPSLGTAQGVAVQSQPDFVLRCDDDHIKPVAIFTDGFQFHCHPVNRLADDMQKRRAIMASDKYFVWSVTWDDLDADKADHVMVCHAPVAQMLQQYANVAKSQGKKVPDARQVIRNGLQQLKAFIETPHAAGWAQLGTFTAYFPLQILAAQRTVIAHELRTALDTWRTGSALPGVSANENGEWVYNDKACLNQDLVTYITVADAVSNRQSQVIVLARLGDSDAEVTGSDFNERWRRFLACLNFYQFSENFHFWAGSEVETGDAPDIPLQAAAAVSDEWQPVLDGVMPSLRSYVQELAAVGLATPGAIPKVEHFNEKIDDDAFAELAWPNCKPPIAILAGDQEDFVPQWQNQGWKVITPDELQAKGIAYLSHSDELPMPKDELRREYELVIDPNGIDDEETYLTTVRSGRPRISRQQRRAAWPVFRVFQRGLKKRSLLTFEGAVHEARLAVEQGNFTRYAHVLVDEVQDFSLEALRLIHAISPIKEDAPDPLCMVGDGHQRIYRTKIPMSRAGIDIRGRSRRLKINYRTSEQIRKFAQGILKGMEIDDLDGGVTTTAGDHSVFKGPEPMIEKCKDEKAEAEAIVAWVQMLLSDHKLATHEICVTPYKPMIRTELTSANIATYELRPHEEDPGPDEAGVRMGTMKRIKGLEFRAVAMACADPKDPLNQLAEAEIHARCERYVAATRAQRYLLVTVGEHQPGLAFEKFVCSVM